ncbi:MAG: hypothetical protein EOO27_01840 [Comamonadaceae bacterium]|nr:MAG: hypothetical protein EOO27_01840 [Comamonadaceae bacterium]
MIDDGGYRRRLVTIAVRDYPHETESFGTKIDEQVSVLTEWLSNPELHDRAFEHQPLHPTTRDSVHDFVAEAGLRDLGPADVLVLYVTGHGIRGEGRGHFLLLGASDQDRPLKTAYRTSDLLAAVLDSDAEHILVLVDSCHAGALNVELAQIREDLPAMRRRLPTIAVLASADFDGKPRIGEFATLLRHVYDRLNGGPAQIAGRYLTFYELFAEIGTVRAEHRELDGPLPVWLPDPSWPDASLCLPNPGYKPPMELVEPQRQQVAASAAELEDYWVDRATGRASSDDPGWYFSGRTELNKSVTSFLRTGEGLLVVTGAAGSGKSAVLARAVTLSDTKFADVNSDLIGGIDAHELPPAGSIDVAVLAREKDTEQILGDLIESLGGSANPYAGVVFDHLKGLLVAAGVRRTVVVDGVDEARHPDRLITDVLGPLSRLRASDGSLLVRLVLGLRSVTAQQIEHENVHDVGRGMLDLVRRTAGDSPLSILRTDKQPAVTDDITSYLASLLDAAGPYAGDATAIAPVVTAVAEKVTPSFLDARLAGQRLREANVRQNLEEPQWQETLADGTISLFRADLDDFVRDSRHSLGQVLAVLRASAFALGRGLPWSQVWPTAAAAVAGMAMPELDQVIASILDSRLSGYLSQDVEDGRVVHRPSHERLAETLRDDSDSLLRRDREVDTTTLPDAVQVHRAIAIALTGLVDRLGTVPPLPYLRRHLTDHACRGKVLDDDHIESAFLPWESGSRVRIMLGLPPSGVVSSRRLAAWSRIEAILGDADIPSRRSSFAFACTADGLDPGAAGTELVLIPRWSRWRVPQGNVLATTDVRVLTALNLPGGRVLLAIGDRYGTVRMWNAETGTPLGEPLTGHRGNVSALTTLTLPNGQVLLASGDTEGTVRMWDPETEAPLGEPLTVDSGRVWALAALQLTGGRVLLASGGDDGTVRLWDPETGTLVGKALAGHVGGVSALTTLTLPNGQVLLASGDGDGIVRIWDAKSWTLIGDPLADHHSWVSALTTLTLPDQRVLLASGGDISICLWDAETRTLVGEPLSGHQGNVSALTALTFPDGQVLLASGDDMTVRRWDPAQADTHATNHATMIRALVHLPLPSGRVLLASGGDDGTVRLWDAETGTPVGEPLTGHREAVPALTALALPDGRVLLASGGDDGTVRLWDPETGTPIGEPLIGDSGWVWTYAAHHLTGYSGWVWALAALPLPSGRVLLASGDFGGTVWRWDAETGTPIGEPLTDHHGGVSALTTLTLPNNPALLASGDIEGTVRLWDAETGTLVGAPLTGHDGSVSTLTTFTLPDGHVFLASGGEDGTVRTWDAETGTPLGEPLSGHDGRVSTLTTLTLPDGHVFLASGGDDGTVRLWDWESGVEASRLVTGAAVQDLTAFADGVHLQLAIGGDAGIARLSVITSALRQGAHWSL